MIETTIQRFWICNILRILCDLCSPKLHLVGQKYIKNSDIMNYNYNIVK